jgi:hypoxanthine phosphoribosyltransferase
VLKGGHAFFTELTRAIGRRQLYSTNVRVPFTFDFIRAKSYAGTSSSGEVAISGVRMEDLAGRDVILVEDIIDSGLTMSILVPMLQKECTSVAVAALITKRNPKAVGFEAQYIGFEVEDAFLVGYNLDYNEAFRELEHLCVVNAAGVAAFKDFDNGSSANCAATQAAANAANEAAEQ